MIADIRFACTRCGQHMRADATAAGLTADCPHCGGTLVVPKSDNDNASDSVPSIGSDSSNHVDGLRQQLAVSVSECERLTAAVTHAQAEIKSFQADRRALKTELARTRQRLETAETHLAEQQQWIDFAQQHATEIEAKCENLQNDLGVAHARTSALTAQLASRESELVTLRTQLAERESAHAAAQNEVFALQEEHAILRADLDGFRSSSLAYDELAERLAQTEAALLQSMEQVAAAELARTTLQQRVDQLAAETETLRTDLKETESGREFVRLREQITTLEAERQRLRLTNIELTEDFQRMKSESTTASDLVKTLQRRLGDAEKRADAHSDERLKQDNLALRGIITRQNGELERRHIEVHRLKRAQLGLRLVYALVVLGIILLGLAVVQIMPSLDW